MVPLSFVLFVCNRDFYFQMISAVFDCIFGFLSNEIGAKVVSANLFRHVYVRPNVVFNFLFEHGFSLFNLEHQHSRETFFEAYLGSSVELYFGSLDKKNKVNAERLKGWKALNSKPERIKYIQDFAATFKKNFRQAHSQCNIRFNRASLGVDRASVDRLRGEVGTLLRRENQTSLQVF